MERVLRGRNREENEAFSTFRGSLALYVDFAAPGKGNEKGGVEGVHGYIEDNFFRPVPEYAGFNELNADPACLLRDLLIQLISQRYERRSIVLTTNLPFEKWTQVFPDELAVTAVIDRLVHHGSVFAFAGKSHRLRSRGK